RRRAARSACAAATTEAARTAGRGRAAGGTRAFTAAALETTTARSTLRSAASRPARRRRARTAAARRPATAACALAALRLPLLPAATPERVAARDAGNEQPAARAVLLRQHVGRREAQRRVGHQQHAVLLLGDDVGGRRHPGSQRQVAVLYAELCRVGHHVLRRAGDV